MSSGRNSLPHIAIIRGGTIRHGDSLDEGVIFLSSLSKLGYEPIDVVVDKDGTWNHRGIPTDAHAIFTRADGYVDTTRMYDAAHHALAKRMGVHNLFPHGGIVGEGDRESIYRILRQRGIDVPDSFTVRRSAPIDMSSLREVWVKLHTPLLVRPIKNRTGSPSTLVRSFPKLLETIDSYHKSGLDVHVLTYSNTPVISIAVLPQYRGEHWYTPLPVKVFPEKDEVPHSQLTVYHFTKATVEEKVALKELAIEVISALDLKTPVCIDIIQTKRGFVVVNVDTHPSLSPRGRFMESLATTGVDIGHYVQSRFFL